MIAALAPKVSVVDLYSVTDAWGEALAQNCRAVVIDDIGARSFGFADLVVNPSPEPPGTASRSGGLLRGPQFALVHSAFRARRPRRTPSGSVAEHRGGNRSYRFSGSRDAVIEQLTNIVGQVHTVGTSVGRAADDRVVVHGLLDPPDLATLIDEVDLVVASSSSSTWEVCTMRRPGVFIQTASNQQHIADWLKRSGVAPIAYSPEEVALTVSRLQADHLQLERDRTKARRSHRWEGG